MKRNLTITAILLVFLISCNTHTSDLKIGENNTIPTIDRSLAMKPPMGWNSWDCLGFDVNEEDVKATADYMAKKLNDLGYEYIVLDMNWYAAEGPAGADIVSPPYNMDEYGRLIPDTVKFPSSKSGRGFKPLAHYVHSLGLKFGIHILGGIPKEAVAADCLIKGTSIPSHGAGLYRISK